MSSTLDLIVDVESGALLSDFSGSRAPSSTLRIAHKDKILLRVMPVKPLGQSSYQAVDYAGDTLKMALVPECGPWAGGFKLSHDSNLTSAEIQPDDDLGRIQDLINGISSIATAGYVDVVESPGVSSARDRWLSFDIHFRTVGDKTAISFADGGLFPKSVGIVTVIQAGTASLVEIVRVQVLLENALEATLASGTTTTASITTDSAGGSTQEIQTVSFSPNPIDGFAIWTVDGTSKILPVGASERQANAAFASATIYKQGDYRWQVVFDSTDDQAPITVSLAGARTPNVYEATVEFDSTLLTALTARYAEPRLLFQLHVTEAATATRRTILSNPFALMFDGVQTETAPS